MNQSSGSPHSYVFGHSAGEAQASVVLASDLVSAWTHTLPAAGG